MSAASRVCDLRIHFDKTCPAVNRTPLRRVKRYGCRCRAFGTLGSKLDVVPSTGFASDSDPFDTAILGSLTFFAAFGWIDKILVAKKHLFAGGPDKAVLTIDAGNRNVLKFARNFTLISDGFSGFLKIVARHNQMLPIRPRSLRQKTIYVVNFTVEANHKIT